MDKLENRLEELETGHRDLKAEVVERFDKVDLQFADIRRFAERINTGATAGDEKLLEMVQNIQENMVTKSDLKYFDLKTTEHDRKIFKLKQKQ
ncbi:hypothetical protein [Aneurinibacillus terranovensis]|uniref:hypothetical protein n=1 Tax=Aneurinibacillus terranovensis TaxID=278991 RepID=UPI0004831B9D|nr:hypothetical protein [Aneurinibacillus terranovensis]